MPALNLDEDSEFRDALIAKGIIDDPRPKTPPSPSSFLPTDEELLHHTLALAEPSTLQQVRLSLSLPLRSDSPVLSEC
jgi:hypothetical protein